MEKRDLSVLVKAVVGFVVLYFLLGALVASSAGSEAYAMAAVLVVVALSSLFGWISSRPDR